MPPIRVLVVDDSVVIRRLVTDVLSGDPDIEVVGTAANGRIALSKVEALMPDAITLDIEMPIMDGIETVRALRRAGRRMPVIMFSTLTERGASATLDALDAGASDYVTKPANVGSVTESLAQVRSSLVPKIKALCAARRPPVVARRPPPVARVATVATVATRGIGGIGGLAEPAPPARHRAPRPLPPGIVVESGTGTWAEARAATQSELSLPRAGRGVLHRRAGRPAHAARGPARRPGRARGRRAAHAARLHGPVRRPARPGAAPDGRRGDCGAGAAARPRLPRAR